MRHVIAFDIGGTNMRAAIINEELTIEQVIIESTITGSVDSFLAQIKHLIYRLDYKKYNVEAITFGVPGRVRADGFITALPNIHIENIPLASSIFEEFGLPTFVKNDAEMAGLCEAVAGAGKDYHSAYFVTISTGIGAAYIENKHLKQILDEPGHTLVKYKNRYYELEQIASGNGLVRLSALNGVEIASAAQFFARVKEGDPLLLPVYNDWLTLISNFFNELVNFFTPEVFILTGGVMHSRDIFEDDLCALVPNSKIVGASYKQEAGLVGAAIYGLQSKGN